jgi:hypothetical protein
MKLSESDLQFPHDNHAAAMIAMAGPQSRHVNGQR